MARKHRETHNRPHVLSHIINLLKFDLQAFGQSSLVKSEKLFRIAVQLRVVRMKSMIRVIEPD